ncbi:hypothetical protein D3C77_345340 [compost metagenome]
MLPVAHGALLGLVDRQQDVRLTGDIRQAHGGALAQWVVGREPQAALRVEQRFGDNVWVGEVSGKHHGHVIAMFEQAQFNGLAFLFVNFDGHIRMPMPQALQVMGEKVANHRVAGGDTQQATGAVVGQGAVEGILDAALNHVGTVEKVPACVSQAHALCRAQEQGHPKQGFELFDCGGYRRLGDVQVKRRL